MKHSLTLKQGIILALVLLFSLASFTVCYAAGEEYIVNVYFFNGDGCPHCASERPFLLGLVEEFGDQLVIHDLEVWNHSENVPILEEYAAAYDFEPSGVPVTFVGMEYWIGFGDDKQASIETAIRNGIENGAVDPADVVAGVEELIPPQKPFSAKITVPFIGEMELADRGLILSTAVIALVDGFNPCSLWVLTMLIAISIHTNSRKKMLVIGLVFLTVTAGIYALFILGVFTLLSYVRYLQWIQILVACLTLVLGLINLKDYFFFKEGVSLTISDDKKPGIYQKMRRVVTSSDNFWAMIGATIALSAGVSLVEFSCTAALPVVWTNILSVHEVPQAEFILLLLLYMLLYQIDEIAIFLAAVFTMKASRMEEKHGRILKLFSGMLMINLSLVMLIKPELMNGVGNTLIVFGIAIASSGVIILLTNLLLPKSKDPDEK